MRGFTFVLAASIVVPPNILFAQQPPALEPGARVRVTHDCTSRYAVGRTLTSCQTEEGNLARFTVDSIVLNVGDAGSIVSIPVESMAKLEIPRAHKSYVGTGAAVGGLAGAVVGGLAGVAMSGVGGGDAGAGAVGGAMAGGLVLGGLGALIGWTATGSAWEEIPLNRLRVSLAPQTDGFSFAFRIAF